MKDRSGSGQASGGWSPQYEPQQWVGLSRGILPNQTGEARRDFRGDEEGRPGLEALSAFARSEDGSLFGKRGLRRSPRHGCLLCGMRVIALLLAYHRTGHGLGGST